MKNRIIKYFAIPIILISASMITLAYRNNDDGLRRELVLKVIDFAIENGHYHPGNIDDGFSEKVFDLYIERLDFGKRFLLQEDIDELSEFKNEIDNEFKDVTFYFLDESVKLINTRTAEAQQYYREILSEPFDFEKEEQYELDSDKKEYVSNKDEMKERWRKSLKYETVGRVTNMFDEQEKAAEKSDTVTIKNFTEIEKEARGKLLKRYDDWFHRIEQLEPDDRLNIYINSIVNVFDPHSQYFPPKDKENFDIRFSGQLEGIGAQLTQKDEYIEVLRIIPGSPSWKQGELEVGDKILKVAQGDEEPLDIVDMRLDKAVKFIRGKKGTEARLTVKKMDGTMTIISIIRDVVVLEETYAKSAIIEHKGNNYGYIKLPSFYVDFSKADGRNCFDDVKIEIDKLKAEQVESIVFDLRDNGGGSLEDVVKIAGLFIKEGPVVQSLGKNGAKRILEDTDTNIQFDKPVVVMVNAISASASEIFAAALQDYQRAIVIGGTSTFGKGTVQNFTELDRMVPRKPTDMKDLGSLKMTIQKFYRINGGATQLKGVEPDIVMPDYYNFMDFGEKDMDNPMPWDEIDALVYSKWTPSYDIKYIEKLSKERISNDTMMQLIDENGERLKEMRDDSEYSLNYAEHKELTDIREEEGKKFERIGKDSLGLVISITKVDMPLIESDTSKKARTDAWLSNMNKDIYLSEAVNILDDIEEYKEKHARKED
ncbi:MAG: tail-specific protease [Bacteroidetes bacterium]|nr:MAG: tail-specific protease [Bacteroidota bacterium]